MWRQIEREREEDRDGQSERVFRVIYIYYPCGVDKNSTTDRLVPSNPIFCQLKISNIMWCHVLAVSSCLPRRCVCACVWTRARVYRIWQLVATTMKWWWWCQRCCLLIHLWTSIRDSLHFLEWSLHKQYKPKWHIPICLSASLAIAIIFYVRKSLKPYGRERERDMKHFIDYWLRQRIRAYIHAH